jgi:starch phosphorylase
MENLEKLIYDLYKKNARQCTNEEIYNALLIYTKNQLFEKGWKEENLLHFRRIPDR